MTDRVRQVAAAVCDGQTIDWDAMAPVVAGDDTGSLRALRTLDDLFGEPPTTDRDARRLRDVGVPYVVILLVAAGFTAAGVAGFLTGGDTAAPPAGLQFLTLITYAAAATFLGLSARTDPRAIYLAVFFLLVAASFSVRFLDDFGRWLGLQAARAPSVVPEVFMPVLLWRFVREFPRVVRFNRWERVCRLLLSLAWAVGILLLLNAALDSLGLLPAGARVDRDDDLYWLLLLGLMAPALPTALARAKDAAPRERQKVRALTITVVATVGLPIAVILLEIAWPAFDQILHPSRVAWVFYGIALAFPCAASWVVVTRRPLSATFVVRRSVQYLLARATLRGLVVVSLASLLAYLYRHRGETVGDLFADAGAIALVVACSGTAAVLATRGRIVTLLQEFLGSAARDYTAAVADLNSHLRALGSAREIARAVEVTLRRELDAEVAAAYLADPEYGQYTAVGGTHRSLPFDAAIAGALQESDAIIHLGPYASRSWFRLLPAEEQSWLLDGGYTVLAPLVETGQKVLGFIALGSPRFEDDLDPGIETFLKVVVGSAVLAFGPVPDRSESESVSAADHPAFTCVRCGQATASSDECACGGRMELALLPLVVGGKFRLEQRLGSGGMGVVYRGYDPELDRRVALKTLPRVSPEATLRLRDEARMMARVSHPGLATIYGLESWRAFPVLVVEYLEAGTLADVLRKGRLSPYEVCRIATALASPLTYLHDAGWLHRDLKPSNIAFKTDRTPKLLDFGLASLLGENSQGGPGAANSIKRHSAFTETSGVVAGTPLYLSPELINGQPPSPLSDLWAFAVTLYESLAGEHPYRAHPVDEVLGRIVREELPALGRVRPDCPLALAAFFDRALSRDPSRRPQTVQALVEELCRSLV